MTQYRILIVEDDMDLREGLSFSFSLISFYPIKMTNVGDRQSTGYYYVLSTGYQRTIFGRGA